MLTRILVGSIKLTLVLAFLGGLAVVVPALLGAAPPDPIDAADVERELLNDINEQRTEQGLTPLVESPAAARVAAEHSETMALEESATHDAGGTTTQARLNAIGCEVGSENILQTRIDGGVRVDGGTVYPTNASETAALSMTIFRTSESHWQNINDQRWRTVGVGVSITDGDVWVTQVFCAS